MAGHMNLLSPFVFNQFGPYNPYAQSQQQAALMAAAQGTYMNPMAALATQIPHALGGETRYSLECFENPTSILSFPGQPVNTTSLPSPTMPTFNMAAQTPNGQPTSADAVYSNGIPHTYPGREYLCVDINGRKFNVQFETTDALQLSIPTQGLANGDAAALPHSAYPGIQPFPGVGKFKLNRSIQLTNTRNVINLKFLYKYIKILCGSAVMFEFRLLSI